MHGYEQALMIVNKICDLFCRDLLTKQNSFYMETGNHTKIGLAEKPSVAFSKLTSRLPYSSVEKPNIFMMHGEQHSREGNPIFEKVYARLSKEFKVKLYEISPHDVGLSTKDINSPLLKCIVIDSKSPEKIRDELKEILWSEAENHASNRKLNDILLQKEDLHVDLFRLSNYGLFITYRLSRHHEFRTHSFFHSPVFYRYRVALDKLAKGHILLCDYLDSLFTDCPNHLFNRTKLRASNINSHTFDIDVELRHNTRCNLIEFAIASESFNKFKSRHENLQKFFLEHDPSTIACEVPVWIESRELEDFEHVFKSKDVLTGHIDLLRLEENGKIGIWDYKPRASEEMNVKVQVFLYAFMLSMRTGIKLDTFTCGYFDEKDVYFFDPAEVAILNNHG